MQSSPSNSSAPYCSVVIPVYNSSSSLGELAERLLKVFDVDIKKTVEVIFVDDASPSHETWPALLKLRHMDPRLKVVRLMKNSGQHIATLCGLELSTGEITIMMDDDLQHRPEDIEKLIVGIEVDGRDAVFGVPPEHERQHSFIRNLGSSCVNRLVSFSLGKPSSLKLSSFRAVSSRMRSAITHYKGHLLTLGSLICQLSSNVANITISHDERRHGKSNYTLSKLFSLGLSNVFNFSDLPLKAIIFIGFLSSALAIAYSAYVITGTFMGYIGRPGFPTLAVLISFFSGLILLSLGVLGQYLMRILKSVTQQSRFVVRDIEF